MNFGKIDQKEISIRFCGSGGMGVILASIILGRAAILEGKNSIQTQTYGAEQRGTKVKSDILISEYKEPNFPLFDTVDILIAFSQDAFNHFYQNIRKNTTILINSDLVEINQNVDNLFRIPANSIAEDLNNPKIMNIVMLGGLIKITEIVSSESIIKTIKSSVPKKYEKVNLEGFHKGYSIDF